MESETGLVVVLGSCSVDYTCYAERLPKPGETLHGYKFTTSFGGKGANQCVAVAKFGGKAAMIAKVGDESWGHNYRKQFLEMGINVDNIECCPHEGTGSAHINVSKCGENQIVIIPAANKTLTTDFVERKLDMIKKAAVLVCQLETPVEATLRAFQLCEGIKILNAAPGLTNLSKALLSLTTVLCVNESEAELISGKSFEEFGLKPMLQELLKTGCETVIITLGAKGAAFLHRDETDAVQVFSDKITPVDTTGAGDAFIGGLATLLSYKKDFSFTQMVGAACKVATMTVCAEGTQSSYPTLDIRTLLDSQYNYVKL